MGEDFLDVRVNILPKNSYFSETPKPIEKSAHVLQNFGVEKLNKYVKSFLHKLITSKRIILHFSVALSIIKFINQIG